MTQWRFGCCNCSCSSYLFIYFVFLFDFCLLLFFYGSTSVGKQQGRVQRASRLGRKQMKDAVSVPANGKARPGVTHVAEEKSKKKKQGTKIKRLPMADLFNKNKNKTPTKKRSSLRKRLIMRAVNEVKNATESKKMAEILSLATRKHWNRMEVKRWSTLVLWIRKWKWSKIERNRVKYWRSSPLLREIEEMDRMKANGFGRFWFQSKQCDGWSQVKSSWSVEIWKKNSRIR